MKFKEFNEVVKKSVKFDISNQSEQIDFEEFIVTSNYKKPIYFKKFAISALSVVLLFVTSFYMYLSLTPVTTLTIDFNPSFEVQLNTFDRVVKIENLNDDGVNFTEDLIVRNKSIDNVMNQIYEKGLLDGYFTSDSAYLLIGVIGPNYQSEEHTSQLIARNENLTTLTLFEHLDNAISIASVTLRQDSNSEGMYYVTTAASITSTAILPSDALNDITGTPEFKFDVLVGSEIIQYLNEFNISQTQLAVVVKLFQSYGYSTYEDLEYLAGLDIQTLITMYQNID